MDDMKKIMEEQSAGFLNLYQSLQFEKQSGKDVKSASSVRKRMLLAYHMSRSWLSDASTCFLFSKHYEDYINIIDDKEKVNNYADLIKPVIASSGSSNIVFDKLSSTLIPEIANEHKDALFSEEYSTSDRWYELGYTKSNDEFETENDSAKDNEAKQEHSFSSKRKVDENCSEIDKETISEGKLQFQAFRTAAEERRIQNARRYGLSSRTTSGNNATCEDSYVQRRWSQGASSRGVNSKFVPPIKNAEGKYDSDHSLVQNESEQQDPRLKNIEPKMIELIKNEIMDNGKLVYWDDVAGLKCVKKIIQEVIVLPLLRPDIFTGIRQPPKGILLFGPPGTGKTLIGKCVASQVKSTFFSISASSLTSKWIGESEKMVRALFAVARCCQPSVIFIDEIDSLLCQRSDTEHESSRRLKTEFLVQLDGATTGDNDRILVIGATNRPQELDEAARRRFVKRLYIPLPDSEARSQMVSRLMSKEKSTLNKEEIDEIANLTEGYSGADMTNLCKEASLGPVRCIDISHIGTVLLDEVRAINIDDFRSALNHVRSSVSPTDLDQYSEWDRKYGSCGR